ncbi:MAG TPA: feruloyl-CoA synthase [Vicinamibacterales bacterium]|nr:feruloyl-CoA synthase [Vicinamibacterales bacterium]
MHKMSRVLPADTLVEYRSDGSILARSPHRLGPYPRTLTERLEHWARAAPRRVFLAARNEGGDWRTLTYADALRRVRSVAQALIDRRLSNDRPVVILSGNSIEHGILALGAMYAGIMYVPVAPSYSLIARDFTTLRAMWDTLHPGLVFAAEGQPFERALRFVDVPELVTCAPVESLTSTSFAELEATSETSAVDDAHARIVPSTIAKLLYTSGSTGRPKGVINTQQMLCSNQEMVRTVLPLLADEPPILCDWLPWNHTFGGNHNFGIVLYNGGTLYIDAGKPTPAAFETTVRNLREIATTAYFNVPRGYDLLVPRLRADPEFCRHFVSRLQMLFCAAASLRQQIADDLTALATTASGTRIPFVTGLGATESAPFALCAGDADFTGGRIGVPAPGVELKLAPVGQQMEGRLRGPNITPGYWADDDLTRTSFDDEGYYKLGDALGVFDPADPMQGFTFQGRIAEDFKLSTGTWVRVGPLRARLLAALGDLVHDAAIAGPDRDFVTALIFPNTDACRAACGAGARDLPIVELLRSPALTARIQCALADVARNTGLSTTVARAMLMAQPPSIDAHETTEKGSINQRAVLANRAALVELLYAEQPPADVIEVIAVQ